MNRGPLWPRVWRGLIGAERPLPGSLCDETPQPAEAGKWQPRDDSEYDQPDPAIVQEFIADMQEAETLRARFFEAAGQPGRHEIATLPTPITAAVQEEIARLLLERDTETQRADRAETKLAAAIERIRGLELTVTALTTPGVTITPLRVADDQLLMQPLPAPAWPPREWTT